MLKEKSKGWKVRRLLSPDTSQNLAHSLSPQPSKSLSTHSTTIKHHWFDTHFSFTPPHTIYVSVSCIPPLSTPHSPLTSLHSSPFYQSTNDQLSLTTPLFWLRPCISPPPPPPCLTHSLTRSKRNQTQKQKQKRQYKRRASSIMRSCSSVQINQSIEDNQVHAVCTRTILNGKMQEARFSIASTWIPASRSRGRRSYRQSPCPRWRCSSFLWLKPWGRCSWRLRLMWRSCWLCLLRVFGRCLGAWHLLLRASRWRWKKGRLGRSMMESMLSLQHRLGSRWPIGSSSWWNRGELELVFQSVKYRLEPRMLQQWQLPLGHRRWDHSCLFPRSIRRWWLQTRYRSSKSQRWQIDLRNLEGEQCCIQSLKRRWEYRSQ